MRLSISVTNYSWAADTPVRDGLATIARRADDAGLDTVWVPDHLVQVDPTVPDDATDMLEAYTTLGYLAGLTERVRLGALVSNVALRTPALLVKAVSTLGVLSGRRAWLGIGAGYRGDEAADMGFELPDTPERFERLEETLQIATKMFAGDDSAYEGTRYRLARPRNMPRPQQPPAILLGGTGERRTLRLVARYADACNVFDIPDEGRTIRQKLAVLAEHCESDGRPFDAIEKTLSTRIAPGESADELVRRAEWFATIGIEHLIFVSSDPWSADSMELLAAAAPRVAGFVPAG
ncbi:MAG TPA: LLM class flavin-dependent oxidoreductase [Nocardioidaceae bacterium]